MHESARHGLERQRRQAMLLTPHLRVRRVLDLGGADVNGLARPWPDAEVDVLDIAPGVGVTVVADAREYRTSDPYDVVTSTELYEHVDGWHLVDETAYRCLLPGGWYLGTAASYGRPPHGARGDASPARGEHYANVPPAQLRRSLDRRGFEMVSVTYTPMPGDVYWRARRPLTEG